MVWYVALWLHFQIMEQVQRFEAVSPDLFHLWDEAGDEAQPFMHHCYGNWCTKQKQVRAANTNSSRCCLLTCYWPGVYGGDCHWGDVLSKGRLMWPIDKSTNEELDTEARVINILVLTDWLTDLSMRSQTSIFPFLLVIKNTPAVSNKNAVRSTQFL